MVEETGICNEVAILDLRGKVWVGLWVDKASEGRGAGRGQKNRLPENQPPLRSSALTMALNPMCHTLLIDQ